MNTSARKKRAISTFGRAAEASSPVQEQFSNAFQGTTAVQKVYDNRTELDHSRAT
jgi:hypothetical protein